MTINARTFGSLTSIALAGCTLITPLQLGIDKPDTAPSAASGQTNAPTVSSSAKHVTPVPETQLSPTTGTASANPTIEPSMSTSTSPATWSATPDPNATPTPTPTPDPTSEPTPNATVTPTPPPTATPTPDPTPMPTPTQAPTPTPTPKPTPTPTPQPTPTPTPVPTPTPTPAPITEYSIKLSPSSPKTIIAGKFGIAFKFDIQIPNAGPYAGDRVDIAIKELYAGNYVEGDLINFSIENSTIPNSGSPYYEHRGLSENLYTVRTYKAEKVLTFYVFGRISNPGQKMYLDRILMRTSPWYDPIQPQDFEYRIDPFHPLEVTAVAP